jgi:hypothetical protein
MPDIRSESRVKFEKQGVYLTRLNVQMGNMEAREQQEAITWLAEEEHKSATQETARYRLMLFFTFVAAAAALVAAWPVVKDWIVH